MYTKVSTRAPQTCVIARKHDSKSSCLPTTKEKNVVRERLSIPEQGGGDPIRTPWHYVLYLRHSPHSALSCGQHQTLLAAGWAAANASTPSAAARSVHPSLHERQVTRWTGQAHKNINKDSFSYKTIFNYCSRIMASQNSRRGMKAANMRQNCKDKKKLRKHSL